MRTLGPLLLLNTTAVERLPFKVRFILDQIIFYCISFILSCFVQCWSLPHNTSLHPICLAELAKIKSIRSDGQFTHPARACPEGFPLLVWSLCTSPQTVWTQNGQLATKPQKETRCVCAWKFQRKKTTRRIKNVLQYVNSQYSKITSKMKPINAIIYPFLMSCFRQFPHLSRWCPLYPSLYFQSLKT